MRAIERGAAAFLVAAAWYALVVEEVIVAAEPRGQPGQSREEWLQAYFAWFSSTLADERVRDRLGRGPHSISSICCSSPGA